jgi:hypothetical protein
MATNDGVKDGLYMATTGCIKDGLYMATTGYIKDGLWRLMATFIVGRSRRILFISVNVAVQYSLSRQGIDLKESSVRHGLP